jgi:hypothetical protein
MIANLVQVALFAVLVGFAVIGALHVDRQLAACSARAGYLEVLLR